MVIIKFGLITFLVAIYFSETGNKFVQWEYKIVKFDTDTDKYGNWFSKYQRTGQLFSLSSYTTWNNLMIT